MINSPYRKYEPFFGNWYLKEHLGGGSFGQVFLIEKKVPHRKSGPQSALKIISLPQSQAEVEELRQNYEVDDQTIFQHYEKIVFKISREVELMSKLRGNPYIVDYEDHQVIRRKGEIGWDILIRMEYLTPLPKKLKNQKILSWQEIGKIGRDICQALEICQEHQILHRDIKPANIMVNAAGDYKLGDFGISRSLETRSEVDFQLTHRVGTLSYMAPEVYNLTGNLNYGLTADLYSLGLVLYRLLNNNRLPFMKQASENKLDGNEEREAFARRMKGEELPPPCQAPPALAAVILKACAFDINQRYQTPRQMRNDLERLLAEENWNELPQMSHGEEAAPDYAEEETVEIISESLYQTNNPDYNWDQHNPKKNRTKTVLVALSGIAAIILSIWLISLVLTQKNLQYVEAEAISLNGTELTMAVGEQEQLDYTIYPHNADKQKIQWSSSNPGVVSVSSQGELKALNPGESTIVASNGEASEACQITVTNKTIAANTISLITQDFPHELLAGNKLCFKARLLPVNANNTLIHWQVNNSEIAEISADGVLTALKPGKVQVTAKAGEFSDSWDLQIIEGLGFWQDYLHLDVGESEVLLPLPKETKVNYFSQDESIAKVDQKGRVTGTGIGTTEIIAANDNGSASCPVAVSSNTIEELSLNLTSLNLVAGETRSLIAKVTPDNSQIRWSSDNLLVAMVDQQGQIKANSKGKATITARAGTLEATCQVEVKAAAIPVKDVLLSPTVLELQPSNQLNLSLEILPENADDKNVIWSSKNSSIATVSNGKVTARNPGTTSVSATVGGITASCTVTVIPTDLASNVTSTVSGEIGSLSSDRKIMLKNRGFEYPIAESVTITSADKKRSFTLSNLYVGMQVSLGLDDNNQIVQIIVN